MAIENDGTKAGFGDSLIGRLASDGNVGGEFVERLLTVAGGIPEFGLANFNGNIDQVDAGVECDELGQSDRRWPTNVIQTDLRGTVRGGFHFNFGVDVGYGLTHVALTNGEVSDADLVPGFDASGAPDAAGDEARAPVPPIFIGSLANVGLWLDLGAWLPRVHRSDELCSGDRRRKDDAEKIVARMQMSFRWDAPDAERVVGVEDLRAVEINLRSGIETVKDKVDIRASEQGGRDVESIAVFPTGILNPLQLGLVIAIKRIFDLLVGKQIEMHVAGNRCRQPSGFGVLWSGCDLAELPTMIERESGVL